VAIEPGRHLLHYRLIEKIGEGGMGVVWRAEDTTLGRDVAIKVLPEHFAGDAERLARFEREAKLLASLGHPRIATVFGLHDHDGVRFLAMEYAPGENLSQRLAREALSLDDTLAVARQLAEALEAAHASGVIHRDLKPANVQVAPDGTIKVLDFGLAKAFETNTPEVGDPSASPTLTSAGTVAGVILGTASYMSPEQARGHTADKRSDLWSLGCVLYEMLTGTRPFSGDTVSDTLAAVLKLEPDWDRLPRDTPRALRRLLRRCLEKDRTRRLHDAADARLEIDAAASAGPDERVEPATRTRSWLPVVAAAVVALAAGWLLRGATIPSAPDAPVRHFFIPIDVAAAEGDDDAGPSDDVHVHGPAVSPDGRRIAYTVGQVLFIRDLDRETPRRIEGIEHPRKLFWSPDGRQLGFLRDRNLWRVNVEGGEPEAVCAVKFAIERFPAWGDDDTIAFVHGRSELLRVPARGGDPVVVSPAGMETIEDLHGVTFLPGGRGVVVIAHHVDGSNRIERWSGDRRDELLRIDGPSIVEPRYVEPGYLLYVRRQPNGGLWAMRISEDGSRAAGEPFRVVENVKDVTASNDGTLVYEEGARPSDQELVWVTLDGEVVTPVGQSQVRLAWPELSPDGTMAAVSGDDGEKWDLWLHDMRRSVKTRVTTSGTTADVRWSPDGTTLLYSHCPTGGMPGIYEIAADGAGEPRKIVEGRSPHASADWTRVVFVRTGDGTEEDIWWTTLDGAGEPTLLVGSAAREYDPNLSPDGKYLAYVSDASGRREVYVTAFPSGRGKWRATTAGGVYPQWSADGKTLYFEWGNKLRAVAVTRSGGALSFGEPEVVLDGMRVAVTAGSENPGLLIWNGYHVPPDPDGVLTIRTVEEAHAEEPRLGIHVVENWLRAFRE
jgi:serine/threonine-protein kinase